MERFRLQSMASAGSTIHNALSHFPDTSPTPSQVRLSCMTLLSQGMHGVVRNTDFCVLISVLVVQYA